MASIDFPASPTVGQLFYASNGATYQWTGTLWLPIGNTTATIYVGDTPPPSPIANQFWFNSALGQTFLWYNDGNTTQWVPANPAAANGIVVQTVFTETGAMATGTTVIPFDDTIPQQTEGDQYMSLSITPKSATSRLVIDVKVQGASSVTSVGLIAALFQDATANALAMSAFAFSGAGQMTETSFTHVMTSGTTSATTFKVRAGINSAGTFTFNGITGARYFGGAMASSIVIQEVM